MSPTVENPIDTTGRPLPPTDRARWKRAITVLADSRWVAVLALVVLTFAFFSITQDHFLTVANLRNLATSVSVLWMVSLGLTFVLLVGGFDLSVGSALALSGIVLATLFNAAALPVGWAVAGTLAVGFAFGALINGVLIGRYKVSFLIVTLGTMSLLRGLVNLLSDTRSQPVSSSVLERVAFGAVLGVPIPVVIGALVFGLSAYVLRYTLFGRDIYAIGGSPQAARLAGLRVGLTVATCYGIAGLGAAAGGILQVGRIGAASPLVGETIMLDAAAAVLLGGTSFRGGSGGVVGTAMGVLFLGALANGLAIAGVASFWQQILTGAIVVVAAVVDKAQQSRSRN